jgi:hypothetical protein
MLVEFLILVFNKCVFYSPFADERCGSYEDWDARVEDFFVCHFFPAADKLIEVEAKIAEMRAAERFKQV